MSTQPSPQLATSASRTSESALHIDETTQIWVREEGPTAADTSPSDAPVVILLHGFTFSLESFDAIASELAVDHRVIRYDLLGHGRTGPDAQKRYAPPERAEILLDVMNALDIERATLIGHSLGGTLAWRFAANHPQRVDKLVLVSGPAYDFSGVENEPGEPNPFLAMHLTNPTGMSMRQFAPFFFASPQAISDERYAQMVQRMKGPGLGQAFLDHLAVFTMPDPTADLANITAPTLVLWGEADQLIPQSQAPRIAGAIADADVITYPGVGHVPHEEAPGKIAADIRDFLNTAH